jgi:hypothetical protein
MAARSGSSSMPGDEGGGPERQPLRPLKVDVEDQLGLGSRGLAAAYLVGRRAEVFPDVSLHAVAGVPNLKDPPLPFCFSRGVELHPVVEPSLQHLVLDRLVDLLVHGRVPDDTDRHNASSLWDGDATSRSGTGCNRRYLRRVRARVGGITIAHQTPPLTPAYLQARKTAFRRKKASLACSHSWGV